MFDIMLTEIYTVNQFTSSIIFSRVFWTAGEESFMSQMFSVWDKNRDDFIQEGCNKNIFFSSPSE